MHSVPVGAAPVNGVVDKAFRRFAAEHGITSYHMEHLTPGRYRILVEHSGRTLSVSVRAKPSTRWRRNAAIPKLMHALLEASVEGAA